MQKVFEAENLTVLQMIKAVSQSLTTYQMYAVYSDFYTVGKKEKKSTYLTHRFIGNDAISAPCKCNQIVTMEYHNSLNYRH